MSAEAQHLRRILDKQPACLMRVGADGVVLAANDAALRLLGAEGLAEVLGGSLTKWIAPAQHEGWRAFSETVSAGTSRSMECDLLVSDTLRRIVFHAVALLDHPDGVQSMIVAVRDETTRYQLEVAVQQADATRQQTPHLEMLLKQGRAHLQDLRAQLEEASRERDRLAALLTEREAANEQLWTEQEQIEQSQAERHVRELQALRDQLSSQVNDVAAERDRVADLLRESQKALADQRVELESADVAVRGSEAMAAAGRLAVSIAQELQTTVSDIDARAACLVAECPLEAPIREQVEQLRADAARTASLARQIQQAGRLGHPEELKSC